MFLGCLVDMLRKDIYWGAVFFSLYLYIIFVLIGYVNFPELSVFVKAYFGLDQFGELISYLFLSFLCFYGMFKLVHPLTNRFSIKTSEVKTHWTSRGFILLVACHLAYLVLYLLIYGNLLNYDTASDDDFLNTQGWPFFLFSVLFKFSVGVILVLYVAVRTRREYRQNVPARLYVSLLIAETTTFFYTAVLFANRTDIVALFAGLTMFEIKFERLTLRKFALTVCTAGVLYAVMSLIEASRGTGVANTAGFQALLFKDYYAPGHMLVAALNLNFIHPWLVIKSNFCNSLILLNEPYLQAPITDLINPGIATRSRGYAFFLFTEGYLVLGWWGWIYNATIILGAYSFWRVLAQSRNRPYHLIFYALLGTQVVNSVRGQSSYFIKLLFMYFIPLLFIFFLATGIRPVKMILHALGSHPRSPES